MHALMLLGQPGYGQISEVHQSPHALRGSDRRRVIDAIGRDLEGDDGVLGLELFNMPRQDAVFHVAEKEGIDAFEEGDAIIANEVFNFLYTEGR
jgi:hypothetical protein